MRTIGKKFLPSDINGGKVEKVKRRLPLAPLAAITHWGVHSDLTDRLHGLTLRLLFPFPAVVERY